MILIPKFKDLYLPVQAKTGVRGRFKIEAVDKYSGKKRVLADWFDNLITTNGANLLGPVTAFMSTCVVGSGNATPALTDTALQTLVASTTTTTGAATLTNSGSAPWFTSTTTQYNFAAGVATGNLSEVGVGAGNTNLFSRALILDGGGAPTTITVLSSEALYVTYQVNQYAPTTDVTGTVVIAGVTYSYTLRASQANSPGNWGLITSSSPGTLNTTSPPFVSNGVISAVTGSITGVGANAGATSVSNNTYSAGSFTNSGTATWGLTNGNAAGGISAIQTNWGGNGAVVSSRGSYQIGVTPSIPKDASHILTLSFSLSWLINTP